MPSQSQSFVYIVWKWMCAQDIVWRRKNSDRNICRDGESRENGALKKCSKKFLWIVCGNKNSWTLNKMSLIQMHRCWVFQLCAVNLEIDWKKNYISSSWTKASVTERSDSKRIQANTMNERCHIVSREKYGNPNTRFFFVQRKSF